MIIMQIFKGNLSKFIQTPKNALVVGSGQGFLQDLLLQFNTVFVTGRQPVIRERNLVYIEDDLKSISSIDLVVLDSYENIDELFPILKIHKPLVIIPGGESDIDLNAYDQLKKIQFYVTEYIDSYHVLKHRP